MNLFEYIYPRFYFKKTDKIRLFEALDKRGYKWINGVELTTETRYGNYKENTCYNFRIRNLDNEVTYGSLGFCQEWGDTIIEFQDIDFKEE